jgi:hypothetical protein
MACWVGVGRGWLATALPSFIVLMQATLFLLHACPPPRETDSCSVVERGGVLRARVNFE